MGELSEKMELVGQEAYEYAPEVAKLEALNKKLWALLDKLYYEERITSWELREWSKEDEK